LQLSKQATLDWWIVKQLRGMVLTDLREFVPEGYFSGGIEAFRLHEGMANATHYSSEMRWGYLAGRLGQKLSFHSTVTMTARQTAATELLMNLGMLAAAEAAQGASEQLSSDAKAKGVSDGNAGPVPEQLRADHIPTLSENIRGALKQYLRYLTPLEAAPFLPLLKVQNQKNEEQLLSDDAVQYFEQLCAKDFADTWIELDTRLKELLKTEADKGRSISGAGFAARVSKLYEDDLSKRSQIILANLKLAHQSFGSSLISGIDEQLKKLGADLIEQQLYALEGSYQRHLERMGVAEGSIPGGWDLQYSLQRATIANEVGQYIWVLRKVPMKSPDQPAGQPTFIINGNVGAIQTASNAVAHVHQQVGERDFSVLVNALMQLSRIASSAGGISTNQKEKLITDIAAIDVEIKREVRDQTAILKWLAGIGSIVQTLGSAQPAWEAVRAAARSVGLPL
jgi:hypothetical protein